MKEWADQIRLLGNESAHPDPAQVIDSQDARDVVEFLNFFTRVSLYLSTSNSGVPKPPID